jgi:hypothetical protein
VALTNAEKQARYRARRGGITPEPRDIEQVDRAQGPLPTGASLEQQAHRYRLYVAQALTRIAQEDPALDAILRRRKPHRRS